LDNFKNNVQNNQDVRELRDNFRNIKEFMNSQSYGNKETDDEQIQRSRDLRDNFKNIKEFMDRQHYNE